MINTSLSKVAVLQALNNAIQFTGLVLGQTPLFSKACSNMRSNLNLDGFVKAPYYQISSAKPPIWLINLCATIAITKKIDSLVVLPSTNKRNSKIGFYGNNPSSIESALILQIIMQWIEAQLHLFITKHPSPTAFELEQYQASIAIGAQARMLELLRDLMKSKQLSNAGMLN